MTCAVIFGGTGFIGTFFAKHLLDNCGYESVYLYDIEPAANKRFLYRRQQILNDSRMVEVLGDVRQPITWSPASSPRISLIANFAAIHREPGHDDHEYFETNIKGAENVCNWASIVNCNTIVFSSSIAPYGPADSPKDERSTPVALSSYGSSKLVAEKIHLAWHAGDPKLRKLVIVRPGVVYGPGEGGNVSRLIKAVIRRYFIYVGNRNTRKAGIYVKELCHAISWILDKQMPKYNNYCLFNATMNPPPSVAEYVDAICSVAGIKRSIPSFPLPIIISASYIIDFILGVIKVDHPFKPARIFKFVRSNFIVPQYLNETNYQYHYTLEKALQDWREANPDEWR